MEGWAKAADYMSIWYYVANYTNFLIPHPSFHDMEKNIRCFAKNKPFSIFVQGDCDTGDNGDFVQMRIWILSKLLWNPELDVNKLINEFLEGYYGAEASVSIRKYLDMITVAGAKAKITITGNEYNTSKWLNSEKINEAMGLMETALHEAETSSDPNHAKRVLRSKLSIDYAFLLYPGNEKAKQMPIVSKYSKKQTVREFCSKTINKTKSYKIRNYREAMNFSMLEYILKRRYGLHKIPKESIPEFCRDLSSDEYFILDSDAISGFWLNSVSFRVEDNKSSTGKALKTKGNHDSWTFQFRIPPGLFEEGNNYRVYISARCEGIATCGSAFSCGVYDPSGYRDSSIKTRSIVHSFPVKNNIGQPYKLYDLGTHKLLPKDIIWAGPSSNNGVSWVFVDRFIVVKEK